MECNFNVASLIIQRFLSKVMEQHEFKYEQWPKQDRLKPYSSKRPCLSHCSYFTSCCSFTFIKKTLHRYRVDIKVAFHNEP